MAQLPLALYAALCLLGVIGENRQGLAAPILVPYDIAVSSSTPLVGYDVFNPHSSVVGPVGYAAIEALYVSGPGETLPVHAVLTTRIDSGGRSLGLIDFYYDGPAAGFPVESYLAVYLTVHSPIAPSQIAGVGLAVDTLSEQGGNVTMVSASPEISTVQYKFLAQMNPASNLAFKTTTSLQESANRLKVFYNLHKPNADALVDPTQPMFSVEMSVRGVPEPGGVALAIVASACVAIYGWRRRRLTSASQRAPFRAG